MKELKDLLDLRQQNGTLCDLVKYVNSNSARIDKRLWIISPFISSFKTFEYLFNINKIQNRDVDFKLLTDINNINISGKKIIEFFLDKGEVRTLDSLHSKLYIMNNFSIITSANLTKRGFFYNHETSVAQFESEHAEEIFQNLWALGTNISASDFSNYINENNNSFYTISEDVDNSIRPLRDLPKEIMVTSNYEKFLKNFTDFQKKYENYGERVWKNSKIKYEIDCYLDYLFHHSTQYSSKGYYYNYEPNLSANENLINNSIREFQSWIKTTNYADESKRNGFEKNIKELLYRKETCNIKDIYDCLFHSLNTYQSQALRFYWEEKFVKKNSPKEFFDYIDKLKKANITELDGLINSSPVKFLGKSSVQELLGLLRDDLPIRNENTNAGLRYLGYDV